MTVQEEIISTVCPRSGCTIREKTHNTNVAKEIMKPTLGLFFWFPEIIQAINIIKRGFRNSDGWIVIRSKENHLTAPLPKSVPKNGKRIRPVIVTKNPNTQKRLTKAILLNERNKIKANDSKP